jgi:hypothetical protein
MILMNYTMSIYIHRTLKKKCVERYQCYAKSRNRLDILAMQLNMLFLQGYYKSRKQRPKINQTPFAVHFDEVSLFKLGTPAFPSFRVARTLHLGSHLVGLLCEEEAVTLLQCDSVSMYGIVLARSS